jgi:hypothetical protein
LQTDLKYFNTQRAKMMKTLFTMRNDPVYPYAREWRSRVVDLIFDAVEPLRVPRERWEKGVEEAEFAPRRALKQELWDIVKSSFELAVTMRCQRASYFTKTINPVDDYTFNPDEMQNLKEWPDKNEDMKCSLILARNLDMPFEELSFGKINMVVTPWLIKVGEDNGDYSEEKRLAKLAVLSNLGITFPPFYPTPLQWHPLTYSANRLGWQYPGRNYRLDTKVHRSRGSTAWSITPSLLDGPTIADELAIALKQAPKSQPRAGTGARRQW